jgi:NADH-quinone oxidoreductase subunit K
MTLENALLVSGALFAIGLFGVLSRRNLVNVIMSLELMFNGVVLAAIAFSRFTLPAALADGGPVDVAAVRSALTGHVLAVFVISVAAAETGLGLALVFALFRRRESVELTDASEMKR